MSDNRVKVTVRLPQDAYDELCAELASFSTDTSRLQYVTQRYLDGYTKHQYTEDDDTGQNDPVPSEQTNRQQPIPTDRTR